MVPGRGLVSDRMVTIVNNVAEHLDLERANSGRISRSEMAILQTAMYTLESRWRAPTGLYRWATRLS